MKILIIDTDLKKSLRKQLTFCDVTTGYPWNDVWETSAETPYWWRVTTRSWWCFWLVVPQKNFALTSQKHDLDLGSDTSSVQTSAVVPQTSFRGDTRGGVAKCRLFSQLQEEDKICIGITENKEMSSYILGKCRITHKNVLNQLINKNRFLSLTLELYKGKKWRFWKLQSATKLVETLHPQGPL